MLARGGLRRARPTCGVAVLAVLASVISLAHPGEALGYNPSGAASYADAHWNVCGVPQQYQCISNDCTAFVSESLHSGGAYPFDTNGTIPKGGTSDDTQWYMLYQPATGNYIWSSSFTFAQNFRNYLLGTYPGGWDRGTKPGTSLDADSGVGTGDVLFYDWNPSWPDGGSEPYDHVNLVVGYGVSSDSYNGDYIDGHSNYRYHVFWTLRTYNAHVQTTVINAVYVDTRN